VALRISEKEIEGIDVLECKGRFTFGDEDLQFRKEIDQLLERGQVKVILDLGGVDEIDTTGLGSILFFMLKLRKAGGRLALANLKPKHLQAVVLMKLDTVLEVFQDETAAVDSFFPERQVKPYDILKFVESLHSDAKFDTGEPPDVRFASE
jgi:anti-sigma B factor antagonist